MRLCCKNKTMWLAPRILRDCTTFSLFLSHSTGERSNSVCFPPFLKLASVQDSNSCLVFKSHSPEMSGPRISFVLLLFEGCCCCSHVPQRQCRGAAVLLIIKRGSFERKKERNEGPFLNFFLYQNKKKKNVYNNNSSLH